MRCFICFEMINREVERGSKGIKLFINELVKASLVTGDQEKNYMALQRKSGVIEILSPYLQW